jgi:hypothetical protein
LIPRERGVGVQPAIAIKYDSLRSREVRQSKRVLLPGTDFPVPPAITGNFLFFSMPDQSSSRDFLYFYNSLIECFVA